jgi:hypothetical protein
MLEKSLVVRFEQDEFALIEKNAKERKVSLSALVRHFVRQGLSNFDEKHEILYSTISEIKEDIKKTRDLSASALGAISLLDIQRLDGEKLHHFKEHINKAFKTGEAVKIGQDEKLFKE